MLSFFAYRREIHYRHVFFALWLVFAVYALAGPLQALITASGKQSLALKFYIGYSWIGVHVALAWAVTTITVGYISSRQKRVVHTAIAGLVVIIISAWLYSPYTFDPLRAVVQDSTGQGALSLDILSRSSIIVNSFSLLMLLAFYVHKYRTDRPIGAYADTLLFLFGIALAIDTAEMLLSNLEFEILLVSQWAILFVYGSMAVCLGLRLKFKSQTIADYYESQCLSDDPAIDRRIGWFDRIILRSFFDPEKVGSKIFLGSGSAKMKVRRTPTQVVRRMNG